jgi:3-hydroxybutyryl-CoA dehydrogenase
MADEALIASSAAVIGAGTMGRGIAQVLALAGFSVALHDAQPGAAESALKAIREQLDEAVEKSRLEASQREAALASLKAAPGRREAVAGAGLVIEAVPETLDLKLQLFRALGEECDETALLATNTSSLSVTRIAGAARRPARVVGLHFFNPPHRMKLVEIVRGRETDSGTVEAAKALVKRLGKESIVVRDSPGFATSRLGLALGLEAMRMLQEGVAEASEIDRAMELGYGHPMGPLRVSDLVGLDVRLSIAEILSAELEGRRFEPPEILRDKVRSGKLGRKSGEGFYRW